MMVLNWLDKYNNTTFGPIQKDEALFLFGLCAMVQPRHVLEYGVLLGQSSRVWLTAGAHVTAVDKTLSDEARKLAQQFHGLELHEADMAEFTPPNRPYDLIFVDASHRFEDNMAVVEKVAHMDGALLIFHDTGHWREADMTKEMWWFFREFGGQQDGDLIIHHPDEKRTIAEISRRYPAWQRLDLWTTNKVRYGMTVFKIVTDELKWD